MRQLDLTDLKNRATSAAQSWARGSSIGNLVSLEGGNVGLVYSCEVTDGPAGDETVVLKVAPPGLPPVRNRDVLRQARVMSALADVPDVGVPRVLFTDPGAPDDVPPFMVNDFVVGENSEPLLEAETNPLDHEVVRGRAFAAARMLAALHSVPADSIGLEDEPVISPVGEVDRWTRTMGTVPETFSTGYEEAAELLRSTAPDPTTSVVVHGDYRLGNMLSDGTEVRAIIDWEIWSKSDPRIDLSWFLFFTREADHPVVTHDLDSGMPTDAELLAEYEGSGGATTADLEWFHALTRYKEAAAMALIGKLLQKHDPDGDAGIRMAAVCPTLIADAAQRVGG
jgi:aminoglycoside phosphotransferase (APT) family kinase protein